MNKRGLRLACFSVALIATGVIGKLLEAQLGLGFGALLMLILVGVLYWLLLFLFDRAGNKQRLNALRHAFGLERRE